MQPFVVLLSIDRHSALEVMSIKSDHNLDFEVVLKEWCDLKIFLNKWVSAFKSAVNFNAILSPT